jgi:rod shape-determining protein MreD
VAHIDRRPGVRPRPTVGSGLDVIARAVVPAGSTIVLMLLAAAPFGIIGQPALLPAITIGCVWNWSLLQAEHLPPPVVFLLGVLLDLLGYLPPGIGVLMLLSAHGVAVAWRHRLGQHGFVWNWSVLALVAFVASGLIWGLVMLLTLRLLSPVPAIFQAGLTIAIHPLLTVSLAAVHRAIDRTDK